MFYAKRFNRMLMLHSAKASGLRFDSGTMKVGTTVTGSFYLHEKDNPTVKYKGAMFKGSFKAIVCKKFVKKKPKKEPLPPALGQCPAKTTLTSLTSSIDISPQGPFDLKSFTVAKAVWKDDGARLVVFVSNHDWTVAAMQAGRSPIAEKGKAYVELSFYNKDKWVTIGEYKRGYKKPFSTLMEIRVLKRSINPGVREAKVKIIDMRGGKVCGEFAYTGRKTRVAGTFVADLPEK